MTVSIRSFPVGTPLIWSWFPAAVDGGRGVRTGGDNDGLRLVAFWVVPRRLRVQDSLHN
jgi:hypothetical protein